MRIDYTMRPNTIRTNARYRGPSEVSKYHNFVGEVLHDITLLGKIIDTNELNQIKGQSDHIKENLSAYFSGDTGEVYSNTRTATTLIGVDSPLLEEVDFSLPGWIEYGDCVAETNTLQSPGTSDPCGVRYPVGVQEGQVIYIRMFVKLLTGTAQYFTIGSHNVNQGEGSLSTFNINSTGRWVGHYITCKHKEEIDITVDVHRLAQTTFAGKVQISDASIMYVDRRDYNLEPLNIGLKAKLNVLEREIQNIIKNM